MAVPVPSMLSAVADTLRTDINTQVSGAPKVSIGTPVAAEPAASETDPRVNLFFYNFAPSGFEPDAGSGDPFRIRIRCIMTAYGPSLPDPDSETGATISGGEIDLRLLGAVMQHFHANPVREVTLVRSNPVSARDEQIRTTLQIVFAPLQAEEINQIWSTQGEATYRPSVAYELALVPITPWTPGAIPAPAGSVALDIAPTEGAATGNGEGAGGGPRLDALTNAELAAVRAAKASPPEIPPTLSFDVAPGASRLTVWARLTTPPGGDPVVTPDPSTLALTYDQAADLGTATLYLHRRTSGAWVEERSETLTVPDGGGSVSIALAVPSAFGEWMISVEAERSGVPTSTPSRRSNPLSLTVAEAPPEAGP